MRAQTNIISIIIIAGLIIALVSATYIWAVPIIEKRSAITDYSIIESFMLQLDEKIVELANTGSGEVTLNIPRGSLTVHSHESSGHSDPLNNTISLKFYTSQPIVASGDSIPISTSNLDYVGEYGKDEPRIITLSGHREAERTMLNMSMRYRELRSSVPDGYVIGLCTPTGSPCGTPVSGGDKITLRYQGSTVQDRGPSEGPLTIIYIRTEVL